MGIRLNFIVEGQTEETFVNQVLKPHLSDRSVWAYARCVLTSRRGGVKHRGGIQDIRATVQRYLILDERGPKSRRALYHGL